MFRSVQIAEDGLEEYIVCASPCVGHEERKDDDLRKVLVGVKDEDIRHLTLMDFASARCYLTCDDLNFLNGLVNLQFLVLAWNVNFVDGMRLDNLCVLQGLRGFELWGYSGINDESMNWLSSLEWMERIKLGRCRVQSLEWLRGIRVLKTLVLVGNEVLEGSFGWIYRCIGEIGLQKLEANGFGVKDGMFGNDVMRTFCQIEGLDVLKVSSFGVSEIDVKKLGSLIELDLSLSFVEGIDGLDSLRKLKILNLKSCDKISSGRLCELGNLRELEKLNVSGCRVNDEVLLCLGGLGELRELKMKGCEVTDVGIAHLAKLRKLEKLDLSECGRVTNVGMMRLKGLELKYIDVSWCKNITRVGLMSFGGAKVKVVYSGADRG